MIRNARRMRRFKRSGSTCAVVLVGALAVMLAGCQHKENASGGVGPSASNSMRGDDVIATVNGQDITSGQLYDSLQHYTPSQISGFPQNPILQQPAGKVVLQNLIYNAATLQLAKVNGVEVKPTDLDTFYNDNKLLQESQSTLTFEQLLANQGYTVDEYKQEVLEPQAAQENLLAKTVTITPADIEKMYATNTSKYTIPDRVHIHRITAASQADAQNLYASLKQGKTMTDLAGSNIAADGAGGNPDDSTDITQWINVDQPPQVLGAAGTALKTAKVGDIMPPYQVQGQWWVIQVADRKPKDVLPLSDVQDLVRINVIRQKSGQGAVEQFQSSLINQLSHAVIKIKAPQYQSLVNQIRSMGAAAATPAPANGAKAGAPIVLPGGKPVAVPSANQAR